MNDSTTITLVAWDGENLIDYLATTGQLQRMHYENGDTTIVIRNPYKNLDDEEKRQIIVALLRARNMAVSRRRKWWKVELPVEDAERIEKIIEAVKSEFDKPDENDVNKNQPVT